MHAWLHWFQGPVFWAALTFLVLGLARRVALTGWDIARAVRRAGDPTIAYHQVRRATLAWLVPRRSLQARPVLGLTSVVFHAALIVVPLFLAGHIALIEEAVGLSWPAIPNGVATALTIVVVVTGPALLALRLASPATRGLSRFQDFVLPPLLALPFLTGLLVMHPAWNPFPFDAMRLLHVISADLVLVLVPITKLSHIALLPLAQLATEAAWRFPPHAGSAVGEALGRGSEPV